MDAEQQKTARLFLPHIIYRQINKKIIVRFPHLQERLATGDIFKESRSILPNVIGRRHVNRGIELPSRPFGFFGTVGSSVENMWFTPDTNIKSISGLHWESEVRKCSVSQVNVSDEV